MISGRRCIGLIAGAACLIATAADSGAEVVRVEIDERQAFADGAAFGRTGAYEMIDGRLFFELDPDEPANARITDLKRAPVNKRGQVEFWCDFFLLKPVDVERGNRCLLYDVHNRGNKLALWTFNEGERSNEPATMAHAGNGFLLREGYSILWTGWNGDVLADGTGRLLAGLPVATNEDGTRITGRNHVEISVNEKAFSRSFFWSPWGTSDAYPSISLDNKSSTLTMRPNRDQAAVEVPHADWAFARWEGGAAIADPTSLYVKDGFRPGWLYELVYTARDPRVSGLGLAGLRDAVSFFRFEQVATVNPLQGAIDHAVIFGISQSGRLIHHFLYEGLNLDSRQRKIFDGAIIHVPGGGKGLFNYRFAMATVYGTYRRGRLSPSDFFPFAPMTETDPVTGQSGDTMARLRNKGGMPKIFFVQTSTEYWSRAASLLHTDVEGKRDLDIDPDVRIYHIAGTQHLGGSDDPADKGICQYPLNPVKHRGPVLRALLSAMNHWLTGTSQPPASKYPRIDDGTLVDLQTFQKQFPKIPDVLLPQDYYRPFRLDPGPRWHSEGIADHVPPQAGAPYRSLVPAVGEDGNEIAGIRLPDVAVPVGTYTGWNLRNQDAGAAGMLAGLNGAHWKLPASEAHRRESNDSRQSIRERYPTRLVYLDRINTAIQGLCKDGYLLEEDGVKLLRAAFEQDFWE